MDWVDFGASADTCYYISLFVEHGVDINALYNDGRTPLDYAFGPGEVEDVEDVVRELRKAGCKTKEEFIKS